MKKRLFIAIPLDQKIKKELGNYKNNVKLNQENTIRWLPKEKLHITIYFLGGIEGELIPQIIEKIHQVISNTNSFCLKFEKIILAPPKKKPRMVWAQFEKNKNYDQLAFDLNNSIQQFSSKKKLLNHKEQIPHVTMARFKRDAKINKIELKEISLPNLDVTSLNLIESQLSPDGAIYSTLSSFQLTVV